MKTVSSAAVLASALLWTLPACSGEQAAPKLHPVKQACISYKVAGQMMNGTTERCHRKYAHEVYEIQNLTMGIAGFTQTQNQHTITIGETIYAIDLATNRATKTKNPMYAGLIDTMKDKDPKEMGDAFVAGMGFTPTGANKTIVGTECAVYNSAQMGTVCLTETGLMLEQSFMGNTTTATKVEIGKAGDEANYTLYQNVPVSDGPDLSNMPNLQDLMNQAGPR